MTFTKAELRGLVRQRERALTARQLEESGRALVEKLLALPELSRAEKVFLYLGVGAEPDTRPVIESALASGEAVALPRITGAGLMEARRITSLSRLVPGPYGIPEPAASCPLMEPEEFDLILVPGVAFTPEGKRLGRGGGYYDRYLPKTRGVKVAVTRSVSLFPDLPTDDHDVNVDIVIVG